MQTDLRPLERALAGEFLIPEDPRYEAVRKPALARYHGIRPAAIARCATAADVAATLAFARRSGLPVAVRSGGHCFAGRSSTTGIVIDVAPMDGVSVAGGVATVGAGTRLAGLYDAFDRHGLTLPAGCGPTVGIAGLTLGGGVGILGRRYGLTCDRLVGAQVVLADGRVVECDEAHDPDLFWALRGAGGGRFGVVTALTFRPVPAAPATTFHLTWAPRDAAAVADAWQHWAPDAPDEMNASLKLTPTGVHVFGAMLGGEPDTGTQLEELVDRAGRDPETATLRHQGYRAAKQALVGVGEAEDADPDAPAVGRSELFRRPLPPEAMAALVALLHAGGRRELNFTPLGGAYNRVASDATAFVHRDQRFMLEHVAAGDDGDWVERSWATAHPWGSGGVYPNFPEPGRDAWAEAYHGANRARLLRVKQAYDPEDVL